MGIYCGIPELCNGCQPGASTIHTESGPYHPVCPSCFYRMKEKAHSHFLAGFLFAMSCLAIGGLVGYWLAGGRL